MLISATVLPDLLGLRKIPVHGIRGTTGSEGCLLLYSAVGNSLIFPISFALLPNSTQRRGGETGINLKAGVQLKYMGSKSWLAPRWGTSLCFTLPSSALESWNTTSPSGVRPWRCVVSTPLSPSQTCTAATKGKTRSSCAPCCAWRGAKWTGASTSVTSCQALREAAPGAGLPWESGAPSYSSARWG